jgi:hypothetical protein
MNFQDVYLIIFIEKNSIVLSLSIEISSGLELASRVPMELELTSRVKQTSTIQTLGRRSSKSQARGIQILSRGKPRILARFHETPIITKRTSD